MVHGIDDTLTELSYYLAHHHEYCYNTRIGVEWSGMGRNYY